MRAKSQKNLQFESLKEQDRLERIERLLGGQLRGRVRRASELEFNYDEVTRQHTKAVGETTR